jgi:hypothetical protein
MVPILSTEPYSQTWQNQRSQIDPFIGGKVIEEKVLLGVLLGNMTPATCRLILG